MLNKTLKKGAVDWDEIGLRALSFLAEDDERLDAFVAHTGFDAASVRAAAHEPHFFSGVLDYLCLNEGLLLAFCEQSQVNPALFNQRSQMHNI